MRLFKTIFIIFFCYLISSCSFIKTGYNNAPKLTIWWLNDYFNLTPTQTHTLEPVLNNLHNWHRQQQLPEIITLLNSMQTIFASDNVTADAVCKQVQAFKSSIYTLQIETIPIIIKLAPTLSHQQIARFLIKLDKRAEKWKSQWWQESEREQLAARFDKAEDLAEKVYGDLSNDQLTLLKTQLAQANFNPATSFNEILRRNTDAVTILKALQNESKSTEHTNDSDILQFAGQSQEIKAKIVQAGFDRMQKSPEIAYFQYTKKMAEHSCETIANLHATTSIEQKLHAKKWLENYIVQLSALQTK